MYIKVCSKIRGQEQGMEKKTYVYQRFGSLVRAYLSVFILIT